ncbi:MAG TPA: hypothetical protein VKA94_06385, partial [Hyphomicrobiales bacterium]|nr:hypothetical protein [Hyphomicrobiales bacterium]
LVRSGLTSGKPFHTFPHPAPAGVVSGYLSLGCAGQGGVRVGSSRVVRCGRWNARVSIAMEGKGPDECHNIAARGQP